MVTCQLDGGSVQWLGVIPCGHSIMNISPLVYHRQEDGRPSQRVEPPVALYIRGQTVKLALMSVVMEEQLLTQARSTDLGANPTPWSRWSMAGAIALKLTPITVILSVRDLFHAHWEITTRGERHTGEQASASYKTSLEDHTTTSLSAGNEHDHSQSLSNCVDVGTRPLPVFEDATTEEDAPVGVGSGSPSLGGDVELQPTGTREQRSSSYQTQLDDPHLGADVGVQHGDQSEMQPLGTTVSASSMGGDGNATVTFGAIPAVAYACLLPSYMGPVSGDGLHQSCADLDLSGGGYGMTAVDSSAMPVVAYGGGLPCQLPIDVGLASGDGFDLSCVDVDHSGNGDGMATANSSAIPAIAIAPGSFSTDLGPSSGDGFDQSCVDVDRSRHVVGGDNTVV